MNEQNRRDVTPDDFNALDGVPTYNPDASGSTAANTGRPDIYQRTGKAAPTEVFPASTTGSKGTDTQFETVAIDREPANPQSFTAEPATDVGTQQLAMSSAPGLYTDTFVPVTAEPDPVMSPAGSESVAVDVPPARRGTIDFGLFVLRLLVGAFLVLDAIKTFFRLGGSEGIAGLENAFSAYAFGDILAVVLPTLELAAGVFLVLGLLTPVAAMIAVIVTGFFAMHSIMGSGAGLNIFVWDAAVWLPLLLLGASLALQFTGPGFYAVDASRSWARRPLASSFIFAILGIAAAVLLWWFGAAVAPLA
ncbi:DoxX family protein [Corynebacterium sp.]|uniref:DoxX family protein n=1 Tax=Corynebacterium sp. TaxID=1720 RepID=UPI002A9139CD|nr:DoxX family protein [Corynebacterium sp.]MDY5784770.1 DoxX family protein [Corynebacterium sp.]